MGGLIFMVIFIVFIVVMIFLISKVNKFKYRAKQTVLTKAGIGSSQVGAMADGLVEKRQLKKFLENHPTFTEESFKQEIKNIAQEIANKNVMHPADDKVLNKIANDGKLEKYSNMNIVGCSIVGYVERNGYLTTKATFSDGRDEYMMFIYFNISSGEFRITKYGLQKGAVVGF